MKNAKCPSTNTHNANSDAQQGLQKIAESLAKVARTMATKHQHAQPQPRPCQLPPIELPVYNGDPLQYPLVRNAFFSLVDEETISHLTKLHYLSKYVAGPPKDVVQHYLLLGTKDAYQKACVVLERGTVARPPHQNGHDTPSPIPPHLEAFCKNATKSFEKMIRTAIDSVINRLNNLEANHLLNSNEIGKITWN